VPAPLRPLKWYREMKKATGRAAAGAFLVEGVKAITQVAAGHPDAIIEIIAVDEPPPDLRHYPARRLTKRQFDAIASTRTPQGIAAVVRLPEDIYSPTFPNDIGQKILLLEGVQDPGNTGTLIRTAAAFGFSGVLLTESCADPFSPKCVQATAGAVLSVWLRRTAAYLDLTGELQKSGYKLVAAALDGDAGPEVLEKPGRLVLALGSEGAGLSRQLLDMADYRVSLPIAKDKSESLNVAACGAILMYLASD
jgi:TrmH family RNA methyltransferase